MKAVRYFSPRWANVYRCKVRLSGLPRGPYAIGYEPQAGEEGCFEFDRHLFAAIVCIDSKDT